MHISSFNIPVFVSEGTHSAKLSRIKRNPIFLLRMEKVSSMTGGLIIYGTSLSIQDAHIVDAIKKSRIGRIAIGIYPGTKNSFQIETEKAGIKLKFEGRSVEIEFFDSTTCPLAY
ncbi:hypothetical protein CTI14_02735 [Methylobacterium radiotolerans]|nr:hypothetical protein CTI14_02735 [Methylobacterium radiotolerans]